MLVLGSSPKWLRQPQNSFVAVASSQCTSSPIDHLPASVIAVDVASLARRRRCRRLAVAAASSTAAARNIVGLAQRRRQHLHADGQAVVAHAERHRHRRLAGQVDGIVHTSFRYIVSGSAVLAPSANAVVGDVGDSSTSNVLVGRAKSRMISVRTCCALP